MEIGNQQDLELWIPGGPLGQQLQAAIAPGQGFVGAQRWPMTRW